MWGEIIGKSAETKTLDRTSVTVAVVGKFRRVKLVSFLAKLLHCIRVKLLNSQQFFASWSCTAVCLLESIHGSLCSEYYTFLLQKVNIYRINISQANAFRYGYTIISAQHRVKLINPRSKTQLIGPAVVMYV